VTASAACLREVQRHRSRSHVCVSLFYPCRPLREENGVASGVCITAGPSPDLCAPVDRRVAL